jgi:uncharacterized protein (TIGR03382 family)
MKTAFWKNILHTALLAVTVCALPALAARDIYLLGNGHSGALEVQTGETRVINTYAKVASDTSRGATELIVDSSTGFSPGDLVLVHQSTGYTPEPSVGDIGDVTLDSGLVGHWELARLHTDNVVAGRLKLEAPLLRDYKSAGAQVVRVPEYTSVLLKDAGVLTAEAWNGEKGGILAFLANGDVTIQAGAVIDVTGLGFRGGMYVKDTTPGRRGCSSLTEATPGGSQRAEGVARSQYGANATGRGNVANGGGGAVCYLAGGAGGGNGNRGGDGGKTHSSADGARLVGGIGGAKVLFNPITQMIFGGGGGAGHGIIDPSPAAKGGAGGGIIFIRAKSLDGDEGSIQANGSNGANTSGNSGAHGAGAGGTVYLRFSQLANCKVQSQGGRGGDTGLTTAYIGPGGGGAGGRLIMQSQTGSCQLFVQGANAGQTPTQRPGDTVNYGATAGGNGSADEIINDGFPETMPTPVVLQPANNSSTNNVRPTFSGTLDPSIPAGAQLVLTVKTGATTLTYTLPAASSWSFTPTTDLPPGSYTVFAELTKQEVWSPPSNTNAFTIDLTPPAIPEVITPGDGSTTGTRPVIQGNAEPNSTVTIYIDGKAVGTAPVNASGTFTYTPSTPLDAGPHTVSVTATDAANNTSPQSNTNTFTVDAVTDTPVVKTPPDKSSTRDNTPEYSGTAEPGSTVTLLVDGNVLVTVTATDSGTWSFTQPTALGDGTHTIQVTAVDKFGNPSASSNTNTFTVDTKTDTPVVEAPANNSTTTDNTPEYSGTAEPGSTITIRVDGAVVGTTTATASGTWSFTQPAALGLGDGTHTIQVTAVDKLGNPSASSNTNTFTVNTTLPAEPDTSITSSPPTTTPNRSATFEFGSDAPDVTYECRLDGGEWTVCTSPVTYNNLADGEHTFEVRARDTSGNVVDTTPAVHTWTVHVGDVAFLGDGLGCSATGGDSSLVLMALGSFLALARRRRQR